MMFFSYINKFILSIGGVMNTEQLQYFLSVAKHLNFTEAAKDFYLTQPAISHRISELEAELGVRLFHRTTRSVTLTKAGELFLEDAKLFLSLQEKVQHKMNILKAGSNLSLTVGYLSGPCKTFLPDLMYQFHQTHPQVDIHLKRYNTLDIQLSMQNGDCDIYFSITEDLIKDKAYESQILFDDSFCLVCRNDHPCMSDTTVDWNKIATEPFLIIHERTATFTSKKALEACREMNFSPRIIERYDTMEELLFAVECGLGITILPYNMKNYMQTNLAYVLLDTHISGSVSAAWKHNDNPAVGWLVEILNYKLMMHEIY